MMSASPVAATVAWLAAMRATQYRATSISEACPPRRARTVSDAMDQRLSPGRTTWVAGMAEPPGGGEWGGSTVDPGPGPPGTGVEGPEGPGDVGCPAEGAVVGETAVVGDTPGIGGTA